MNNDSTDKELISEFFPNDTGLYEYNNDNQVKGIALDSLNEIDIDSLKRTIQIHFYFFNGMSALHQGRCDKLSYRLCIPLTTCVSVINKRFHGKEDTRHIKDIIETFQKESDRLVAQCAQ
jgi:hypothetical protein